MSRKITTKEFIQRARSRHGRRYDYSKVCYLDARSKVEIGCSVHGLFQQSPTKHLGGQNCPKCAGNKKRTTREFIQDARKVHGDEYDYTKAHYKNARSEVTIICRIHGKFDQIVGGHLIGQGCPRCAGNAKRTTEEFIQKAAEIHGEKYDYRNVNYSNNNTPVEVICKNHGAFQQAPIGHLEGKEGCIECYSEKTGFVVPLSQDSYVRKALEVHGDQYDYSLTEYLGAYEKIKIICDDHGPFVQRAGNHVLGIGCPDCGIEKSAIARRVSADEFIQRSREVHEAKYDYGAAKFIGRDDPVRIVCPDHGVFSQTPRVHMRGHGCPECGRMKLSEQFSLGVDEFIRRAHEIHGHKFDYSNVEYVNKETPVDIVCPVHGSFEQTPGNHIYGEKGCAQCANNVPLTNTVFVERAKKMHGDFYDYSHVEYVDNRTNIKFVCPEHGAFEQSPGGHLSGRGCPSCGDARKPGRYLIERAMDGDYDKLDGYVYVIHAISPRGIECWKVGVGQKTRLTGIRSIMRNAGFEVLEWEKYDMPNMSAAVVLEDVIHTGLFGDRFKPIVRFGGWNELFTRKPDVKSFMRNGRFSNFMDSSES